MKGFISLSEPLRRIVSSIVNSSDMHARWLNTLSFLENCGARKIAACEHPTLVKEEILKHAAEEFRHSHYLKRQICKITTKRLWNYSFPYLLGGISSLHYVQTLDLETSRYLSEQGFSKKQIKEAAYLLVTFAIELRAEELYPIYDQILRQAGSKVNVRSILLEEKEHLNEMRNGLQQIHQGFLHAEKICEAESKICLAWLQSIEKELGIQT